MRMTAIAACSLGALFASSAVPHDDRNNDRNSAGELVRLVRQATAQFRDPAAAEAQGYHLLFGCVSGPDIGAMGLHYVNMSLVGDGELDATQPEIVIYEPLPNGRLRLIGADYLVLADVWNATHSSPPDCSRCRMKKSVWARMGMPRIWSSNAESTNARIVAGVAALMTATTSRARFVVGDWAWARAITGTKATTARNSKRRRGLIRFSERSMRPSND